MDHTIDEFDTSRSFSADDVSTPSTPNPSSRPIFSTPVHFLPASDSRPPFKQITSVIEKLYLSEFNSLFHPELPAPPSSPLCLFQLSMDLVTPLIEMQTNFRPSSVEYNIIRKCTLDQISDEFTNSTEASFFSSPTNHDTLFSRLIRFGRMRSDETKLPSWVWNYRTELLAKITTPDFSNIHTFPIVSALEPLLVDFQTATAFFEQFDAYYALAATARSGDHLFHNHTEMMRNARLLFNNRDIVCNFAIKQIDSRHLFFVPDMDLTQTISEHPLLISLLPPEKRTLAILKESLLRSDFHSFALFTPREQNLPAIKREINNRPENKSFIIAYLHNPTKNIALFYATANKLTLLYTPLFLRRKHLLGIVTAQNAQMLNWLTAKELCLPRVIFGAFYIADQARSVDLRARFAYEFPDLCSKIDGNDAARERFLTDQQASLRLTKKFTTKFSDGIKFTKTGEKLFPVRASALAVTEDPRSRLLTGETASESAEISRFPPIFGRSSVTE